jgi:hypothetical protein
MQSIDEVPDFIGIWVMGRSCGGKFGQPYMERISPAASLICA